MGVLSRSNLAWLRRFVLWSCMVFVLDVFVSTGTVFAQGSPPPEYYGLHIGPPTPVSGRDVHRCPVDASGLD